MYMLHCSLGRFITCKDPGLISCFKLIPVVSRGAQNKELVLFVCHKRGPNGAVPRMRL